MHDLGLERAGVFLKLLWCWRNYNVGPYPKMFLSIERLPVFAVEKSARNKLNSLSIPTSNDNMLFQEKLEYFLFVLSQSILA